MKSPKFVATPAIPEKPPEVFYQTITLHEHGEPVGTASWHTIGDGVVQILHIEVHGDHGRKNLGTLLLNELYEQIKAFHKARKTPPRRLYITVQQAGHLKCRAFLTRHGYHHTATLKHLFSGQDAMVYQRGFD